MSKAVLKVEGMTCSACARSIEKALQGTEGVVEAGVNFPAKKAYITFNEGITGTDALLTAVESAGYTAIVIEADVAISKTDTKEKQGTITEVYRISGMSCASCAQSVEKIIADVDGVFSANVSFATNKLALAYVPGRVDLDALRKLVETAGYKMGKSADDSAADVEEDEEKEVKEAHRRMVIAGVPAVIIVTLMIINMFVYMIEFNIYTTVVAILAFPVIFIAGSKTHKSSLNAVRHRSANMDVLVQHFSNKYANAKLLYHPFYISSDKQQAQH
ncbi:MAG: copper ion binding protein [Dethiobacter sp.]|jgi:Cu+-exporting ATPase|nr:copper ion binding protein [Dethiobacter sp.]